MKKLLTGSLLLALAVFQYQIWFGGSSVRALNTLQQGLDEQRASNQELQARNRALEVEVLDLQNGLEAVEERARSELGMIGKDETFYMIVD
jgi:cell division protein FtsB